jgi:hypothetical protein
MIIIEEGTRREPAVKGGGKGNEKKPILTPPFLTMSENNGLVFFQFLNYQKRQLSNFKRPTIVD